MTQNLVSIRWKSIWVFNQYRFTAKKIAKLPFTKLKKANISHTETLKWSTQESKTEFNLPFGFPDPKHGRL